MTMTTKQLTTAIASLGLVASVVAIAPGVASAQHAGPSAPGAEVERFEPTARFIVEADSFTAIDESGFDWAGSDEVYAIWSTGRSGVSTSVVDDVDTGDTIMFPSTERCIYPIQGPPRGVLLSGERGDAWTCADGGGFAPVEFRVWLFEADYPFECTEQSMVEGVVLQSCADDMIGFFEFSLDESQLVQTFAFEGSTRLITRRMGGPCGYVPPGEVKGCSGLGSGPEYDFRFRITRVADASGEVLFLAVGGDAYRVALQTGRRSRVERWLEVKGHILVVAWEQAELCGYRLCPRMRNAVLHQLDGVLRHLVSGVADAQAHGC